MADSTGLTLITGASRGIGAALAEECAWRGSDLVLVARSEPALQLLAGRLQASHGIHAHVRTTDLSQPDAATALLQWCRDRDLTIDALINNAGFGLRGRFADLPLEEQEQLIRVNVTAPVALTHVFLPTLQSRPRAYVLNVASMSAFYPVPYMAAYGASKSFILSFTQALRHELRGTSVSVSCLAPGNTRTEFFERAGMALPETLAGPADRVARAGIEGLLRGKEVIVPGGTLRALGALARHLPASIPMRVISRYTRPSR